MDIMFLGEILLKLKFKVFYKFRFEVCVELLEEDVEMNVSL